ncbi:hypothetical protein P175DRAFT_0256470 [Aspergillus ochraceoroseus IBT 24754]|uniref:Uncharacterized protein n=1 Tax=Aspergillus ochraceoroseus IBT 24754 TaxID=1392256 RepID=A0A2T5LU68_9EURO|nr:uncharacterized protein P175DRAFT_0256470 [Aspergillus ochraceoroseus IBT 24754]PTU19817.1 hypothetical protein P175DRAFT_0256470 [Aspergillus ochraceoroseus IBT 24754]
MGSSTPSLCIAFFVGSIYQADYVYQRETYTYLTSCSRANKFSKFSCLIWRLPWSLGQALKGKTGLYTVTKQDSVWLATNKYQEKQALPITERTRHSTSFPKPNTLYSPIT